MAAKKKSGTPAGGLLAGGLHANPEPTSAARKPAKRDVYILLTASKAHAYSTWTRARKVADRCVRLGVKFDFITAELKTGDRYPNAKIAVDPWSAEWCAAYCGSEVAS